MRTNKTSVGWAKKAAGAREEAQSPKVGHPYVALQALSYELGAGKLCELDLSLMASA